MFVSTCRRFWTGISLKGNTDDKRIYEVSLLIIFRREFNTLQAEVSWLPYVTS